MQNILNIYSNRIVEANTSKVYPFEFMAGPCSPSFFQISLNQNKAVQVLLKCNCRNYFLGEDNTEDLMLSNIRNEIMVALKSVGLWGARSACILSDLAYARCLCRFGQDINKTIAVS